MKAVLTAFSAWSMPASSFVLPVPAGVRARLATSWLFLGLSALIGSGLFSVLLVLARTPYVQQWLPFVDMFHIALVVHVDLSVLVWFVALGGVMWTLNGSERFPDMGWLAFGGACIGTLLMSLAPFVGAPVPLMSNYIPVLDSPVFLSGLGVLGAGFALLALRGMLAPSQIGGALAGPGALRFGLNAAAVSGVVAVIALVWSWAGLPADLSGKPYYEMLFWGPGHVLQFTWTLLMLVSWLWLASLCGTRLPLSPRIAVLMFAVGLAAVFAVPLVYLSWPVLAQEHTRMLTWLMRFGGGLAILPMGMAVLIGLLRSPAGGSRQQPMRAALLSSMLLFCCGGVIGFAIAGSDVRIPAHYHGCIVGVTLALMGVVYALLPSLGYTAPLPRLAASQPWVYAGGQLLHITGLVWSGGYGVQRKVAGSGQVLRSAQEVAGMGMMGLGGLIAIVGGVLFLVVVLRVVAAGRPVARAIA